MDQYNPFLSGGLSRQHMIPNGLRRDQYIDASEMECFKPLKCDDKDMRRVAVVPYYFEGGHIHIRLAAPLATKEEDIISGKKLPFQISRGCLDAISPNGKKMSLRTEEEFQFAVRSHLRIEDPMETAFHEASEELGVDLPKNLKRCIDCGVLKYNGTSRKNGYGIQLYAVEVEKPKKVSDNPVDSREVGWFDRRLLDELIQRKDFKEQYNPMVDAVLAGIKEVHQQLKWQTAR